MSARCLPIVKAAPVIAGIMGTDPLRQMDYFLRELDALGFSGINNFPTVGLIDGRFRMELERTNMGFGKEVDAIRLAHTMGFFTVVYVFNPDEADRDGRGGRGRDHRAHGADGRRHDRPRTNRTRCSWRTPPPQCRRSARRRGA